MRTIAASRPVAAGKLAATCLLVWSLAGAASAAEIAINTTFPGGNVLVTCIEGNTVHIAPDLRGGRAWFAHAGRYERGEALNRVADLYDQLGQHDNAIETRRAAIAILRRELDPEPVGIFGPLMAADLLDALNGIPTATVAEKQAAADIALSHKVQVPSILQRIHAGLEGIQR